MTSLRDILAIRIHLINRRLPRTVIEITKNHTFPKSVRVSDGLLMTGMKTTLGTRKTHPKGNLAWFDHLAQVQEKPFQERPPWQKR